MIRLIASFLIFCSIFFGASFSLAAKNKAFVMCKNRKIVRTIRVEKDPSDEKFVTLYTKFGKDKEIGRAQWFPSAEKIMTNVQANLEKAGWNCREVEKFQVVGSGSQ